MLDCSSTLDHVKQVIHSKSGIPPQEQRLFFQQKPITCSSALHKVDHGGNIFMTLGVVLVSAMYAIQWVNISVTSATIR